MTGGRVPRAPALARLLWLFERLRLGVYGFLVLGVGYVLWRYDRIELPAEGCSPLSLFVPGDRLLIDLRPGQIEVGAAVLYRGRAGELLLGRVQEPPPTASAATWEAWDARRALWIVGDRHDCPGPDSRSLGPIPAEGVEGRVVCALSW